MDRPPASRISASSSRENGENARIRPLRCPLYVYPRLNLPRFFVPFSIEFERHTFSFGLLDRSVSSLYSSLVNANEIYMPSTLGRIHSMEDTLFRRYTTRCLGICVHNASRDSIDLRRAPSRSNRAGKKRREPTFVNEVETKTTTRHGRSSSFLKK